MSLSLGVGILIAGIVAVASALLLLRLVTPAHSAAQKNPRADDSLPPIKANPNEAVIIVQPGGRLEYINEAARPVFNLRKDEAVDLERLTRRVRPTDDFLELCVTPGSKRLYINGKPVLISSYEIPGTPPRILISAREAEANAMSGAGGLEESDEILRVSGEFSQTISAGVNLDETARAILNHIGRLVPSDLLELKLWNEERRALVPFRFQNAENARSNTTPLSHFGGLTHQLTKQGEALLLNDLAKIQDALPDNELNPIHSYLGVLLKAGGELIGALEAGQISDGVFSQHDLNILRLISGQAAIAIRNAKLYEEEQRRRSELSGLAKLNQTLAVVDERKDTIEQLVENVAPLFQLEIFGFLIYDEQTRALEAKNPFRGLPAHFIEIYRSVLAEDSPAEALFHSQAPIVTTDAIRDENWRTLGLSDIATAASFRDTALIPLLSSGRMLGYLQAGHHVQGSTPFSAEELRLLSIVANQAASILENNLLVRQSRARAQRAEALRRIASLAASAATLDEILKYSVRELSQLFEADGGAVFLLDEVQGSLNLNMQSAYGVSEELGKNFIQIHINDPAYRQTVSGSQRPFFTKRLSAETRILPAYRPLATTLAMESAIVVPLSVRGRSLGELMLGSHKPEQFTLSDLQAALTAAGQLAAAIETAGLLSQTDDSLRLKADQLSEITRIGHELLSSFDVKYLLDVLKNEAKHLTAADCASISAFDLSAEADSPVIQLSVGCSRPETLTPYEKDVLESGEERVVGNYKEEALRPPHENAVSAAILPIIFQSSNVGLLTVHSNRPDFFTAEKIDVLKMLTLQAGVAIRNASRYQEEKERANSLLRRSNALRHLTDVSARYNGEQPLDDELRAVAKAIRDATPFQAVLVSVLEADGSAFRRVASAGISEEKWNELTARKQPFSNFQKMMRPEFKVSRSYFIPKEQSPIVPFDVHILTDISAPTDKADAWQPEDLLLTPLENADGKTIGLLSVDHPSDGLRPSAALIELIEAFAAQAAFFINASSHYEELNARVYSLSSAFNRQLQLINTAKDDLPILLRKDLEQTILLHNLERRTQRVRAGLAITESVSRQVDANSALSVLGRETLTQLGMTVALIAENTFDGPRLIHILGSLPRATNVETLFGQRNPLRSSLQSGEPILIPNLDENDEWRDSSLLSALRAKSLICLPIIVEDKPIAAMLAVSNEPLPSFTDEDRHVYFQIYQQASVILQNISLLNQTRRRLDEVNLLLEFSRDLSGMDADAVVNSLLASARRVIPHAHAGFVLLWDERLERLMPRVISGYADNESMEKITYKLGEALPGTTFLNRKPRRVDEINFPRDYNLELPENLIYYRQATGGRLPVSSLVVPIASATTGLGVLVLDNFNTTGAFSESDQSLIISLTQQVALSLENMRLVERTQERAGQLQALNNASTTMTSLNARQLTESLLNLLSSILPYDTATLWMRDHDRLTVVSTRGFSDSEDRHGITISVSDSALFKELAQTGQPLFVKDVREDPRFMPVDAPRLSWLGIPLIYKNELMGALAVEKWQANFYSDEQMQAALTFASQAAVSFDNSRLLEDSISRADELNQRTQRLAALNRLASTFTRSLDVEQIFAATAEELSQGLNAERVSIVVFERGQSLWKYAAPRVRAKLPRLLPDAPIFERLRESRGIFNTDDALREPDVAPLAEMLGERAKALLILPLTSGGMVGALAFVQLEGEKRFSANGLETARTITNQASIALENARLYQSSVAMANRFSTLNETSSSISSSLDSEEIYAAVHEAAKRLMPVDSFIITLLELATIEVNPVYLFDRDKRVYQERIPFGRGLSGKVISSGKPYITADALKDTDVQYVRTESDDKEDTRSIIAVPMMVGGKALGMLSAQSYQADVYSEDDVQSLSLLANQAIVAIQNGQLFNETQQLTEELESRVLERTAQLQREKQNTDALLQMLMEAASTLDLERALGRTLSLLNDVSGAEQGTILMLSPQDNLLHYRAGYGYKTDNNEPSAPNKGLTLKSGEGLAGWVFQNREAVLIDDLHEDPRWVRNPGSGAGHRSAIVVPMRVHEETIGVLMVFHRQKAFFDAEKLTLVSAIASQISVAVNNARLYELIRDQAERLGVMFRKEQVDASRSQSILEAVADGVLVTDANNNISFVNLSFTRVLDVAAEKLLGKSLENFSGLFGESSVEWIQAIERWSRNPSAYQAGESYAEQLELENGKIVLVHLAPVIHKQDFLGTVSIFRDITREVEVDRLKSEFVTTVSHELRTPMTSIKGYVDILTMGAAGELNEKQGQFLQTVSSNIERLNILLGDLLDISNIESGEVKLSQEKVDLREVAEEVVADVSRRAEDEAKPMTFSLDAPKSLPPIIGDGERVRQILGNLVNNAFNYTPENGAIKISLRAEKNEVQVDVQDNGVGVKAQDQERLFERFYRGEDPLVLAAPGTGLGLSIVRQLVEMHNGRIWMKSSGVSGEGSVFSFALPVYENGA
ncbi:MAG: GAF domain-containing protein [Anaerolineales bacterium]|nr:GAF domain-containing protein [Anaerolineales bacterium]